ncbi:hypothetical protein D3C72_2105530 [compost metagenome]
MALSHLLLTKPLRSVHAAIAGSRSALVSEINGVLIWDMSKAGLAASAAAAAAGALSVLPHEASDAAMATVRPSGASLENFIRLSGYRWMHRPGHGQSGSVARERRSGTGQRSHP